MRRSRMLALVLGVCALLGLLGVRCRGPGGGGEKAEWGFFSYTADEIDGLENATWARQTGVLWYELETPPGSGIYDWSSLDTAILNGQAYGLDLIIVLKSSNRAAYSDPACFQAIEYGVASGDIDPAKRWHYSCPILPAYEASWRELVTHLVERYDGDGTNDMPGLLPGFPLDVEIENEAADPSYWHYNVPSDGLAAAASYLRLLELSHEAKQTANPGTRIILSGLIQPAKLARCDGNPGCGYALGDFHYRNVGFTKEVLANPQLFDAVDVHLFQYFHFDPSYIPDSLGWLTAQMQSHAYVRPIYSLEWTGSSLMRINSDGLIGEFQSYFPYSSDFASPEAFLAMYQNLDQPGNEIYRQWFEMEQATEFGKLFATMLVHGVTRAVHVQYSDFDGAGWDSPWWNWQGIIKYLAGAPVRKPSYYTSNLFSQKLSGFALSDSLDLGAGVHALRFLFKGRGPVVVLWSEGGPISVDVSPFVASTQVRVFHIVTELDGSNAPVLIPDDVVPADSVPLTSEPVLVEEEG